MAVNFENEEWRDIEGYKGKYQVSNYGRIKSFQKNKNGHILSIKNKTGWYLSVNLCKNKHCKTFRIHRLVAEHFIENPKNLLEVNHKDMNKQNNYYKNLEWIDRKGNHAHAIKNKPEFLNGMIRYNRIVRPKPVHQYTLSGKFVSRYNNCKEASISTGVCSRDIHLVASKTEYKPNKVRKQAGGFIWTFDKIQDIKEI